MLSYRLETEETVSLKEAIVQNDILELGRKIEQFKNGELHEEKFRALRLARGVYGQRQQGVQMIRIKLPFGKVTSRQLRRIAAVSDEYSNGHLHITTRQDIQIHHVSLDRTPELWAELEKDDVTLREACGNTVRNVTASATAGIDPNELFDVAPYADAVYRYFLRKPFGQELGRKIKIAFSATEADDAYTFMHDFGFIPKIENGQRGFKVLVGGGLGAQPLLAKTAFEFLPENAIIPFIEAAIRVFDRHGERNNRNKARLKYLIAKIGWEAFAALVEQERKAVQFTESDALVFDQSPEILPSLENRSLEEVKATATDPQFQTWLKTNVFPQKQEGYVGVFLKVQLGNFSTNQARKLADLMDRYAADDARFTIDQSLLLKFVLPAQLEVLYNELEAIKLADAGYNSVADITACPGTDTCNLGISNSTETARVIEEIIREEYPELLFNKEIKIKISGCMNSCGQHGLAHIGFHGSSIKVGQATAPALQLLLGGGNNGNGFGRIAEKVIKFPSKRVLQVIRTLLNDYLEFQEEDEVFNAYYDRRGNKYFYDLLKPLADTTTLEPADFIDWGADVAFKTEIGIGECAGVVIDLVATLFFDAEEKQASALEALGEKRWADAVYHAYAAAIHAAKALLLRQNVRCNMHQGIISDFDEKLAPSFSSLTGKSLGEILLNIREQKADEGFATNYLSAINAFLQEAIQHQQIEQQ